MQTLSEIRQLLIARGLRPKHRLGQNFLHDKNQLARLVDAAQVGAGDLVLEVGPGTGTLTEALLARGANVIAAELDNDMADIIEERLGTNPHLTLIRGDALAKQRRLAPAIEDAIAARPFKLVANLPYQIASPLLTALLIDHPNCRGEFVTIQKEVADRLLAAPSTKAYGALTIIVQTLAEVERLGTVSPACFWPPPEVTSAMVAIRPRHADAIAPGDEPARDFARFVTALFTRRRKQLGSAFGRADQDWAALHEKGVRPDLRPEALTPEQIVSLWKVFGQRA